MPPQAGDARGQSGIGLQTSGAGRHEPLTRCGAAATLCLVGRDLCIPWLVLVLATGCTLDEAGSDAGPPDAGMDAGPPDAGGMDAGPPDAGAPDAGALDAGPPDAGPPDAGAPDGGPPADAGAPTAPVAAGLFLHLDARDPNGDGSAPPTTVTTWTDLTGGNDATCVDVVHVPDGISAGNPSVFTDGTVTSQCEFARPFLHDLTIAIVFRSDETGAADDWYDVPSLVGGDAIGDAFDAAMHFSGGHIGFSRRGAGLGFQDPVDTADGVPHVATLVRHGGTGAVELLVDGRGPLTGAAGSGPIDAPAVWWLSNHESAGAGENRCNYGEVLVYDRALDPTEMQTIHDWLRTNWGV